MGDQDDPANWIDDEGRAVLQQHLVGLLMGCPDDKLAALLLEGIALMSKRFIQKDWPALVPELIKHLQQQENPINMSRALEAIKKICKKYRYMFRSDDLYREMNYMIENLSPILLNNLTVSAFLVFIKFLTSTPSCYSLPAVLFNSASKWDQKPSHKFAQ